MLKGINKQIVVVKNMGSDFFEEAIFIIKPQDRMPKTSEDDLASEARKIIDKYSNSYPLHITQNIGVLPKRSSKITFWEKCLYGTGGLAVVALLGLIAYVAMYM